MGLERIGRLYLPLTTSDSKYYSKNDGCKDEPDNEEGYDEGWNGYYYSFIPRMVHEPFKDSFHI